MMGIDALVLSGHRCQIDALPEPTGHSGDRSTRAVNLVNEQSTADRRAAFEAIARPLMAGLYRTALRLTRRPEDAMDVVQETYLRAYRTFASFTPGTNARAWLFTILYSVHINRYRKERRTPQHVSIDDLETRFDYLLADRSASNPMEGSPVGAALSYEIDAALDRLPEAYRSAVLLVDIGELTYDEAATVLQCPAGTVRSRLFRARKLLFVSLQDHAVREGFLKPIRSGGQ